MIACVTLCGMSRRRRVDEGDEEKALGDDDALDDDPGPDVDLGTQPVS